jgi:cyclopropane-fatty-acyl-phospholipid synthase
MTAPLRSLAELAPSVSGPWDHVGAPPDRKIHAAIARSLFYRAIAKMPIRVHFPDGTIGGAGGDDAPVMRLHRPDAFYRRVGSDGLIGFGESYMVGDWDADDLAAMLGPFAERLTKLVPAWMQRMRHLYVRHQPSVEENTPAGARQNIERHYDLSNDLFSLFLDDSMTYSSAWFMQGDTLEIAQARKVDRLLDAVGVALGTHMLEIGTGWGSMAISAARRGAKVTTLTLSSEQQDLARQRAAAAGVGDRVDVQLRDYRDAEGQYDAVVSVEMIEAVGERYWPTYFSALDRLVTPHGRVGLQAIVLDHSRMIATRHQYTWISKYIFPGGALPSIRAIDDCVRDNTNLRITERFHFGDHYARTLHCWKERFDARAEEVETIGFNHSFRRMWDLYLAYSEAGFATGYLDVAQLVLEPRH